MSTIPLVRPYLPPLQEIEEDLRKILQSGRLTNFGTFSKSLEKEVRAFLGVKHALCVSNATTGLILVLNTLPEGSEVLVPSFTFLPTVQAVLWNGLSPVFVDINTETYTISPEMVESAMTDKTSAILAVNTFGAPCMIQELEAIAKKAGVRLFFDSAHAFGAQHKGKYLGSFGDAEVFSLSATKLLACGEGGIVTTNNDSIREAILERRNYGFGFRSCDCSNMGLNGKITEFSAILGIKGLKTMTEQITRRNEIAQLYTQMLADLPGLSFQKVDPKDTSTYKDFTICVEPEAFGMGKGRLMQELKAMSVETASYFSPAVHQMTYFKEKGYKQTTLHNTNFIQQRIMSLPIYVTLQKEEIAYVSESIRRIHEAVTDFGLGR